MCVLAGCQAVWSQRRVVLSWPQLWAPTPPIWESWTWATIIQETQEWSCSLLDSWIHAGGWTLWGRKKPAATTPLSNKVVQHKKLLISYSLTPSPPFRVESGGAGLLRPGLKKCKCFDKFHSSTQTARFKSVMLSASSANVTLLI